MIEITDKTKCCGCQACGDICGKKAISFKTDEEGIWYPVVDKDKCVECGICEKVCPIINSIKNHKNSSTPKCYVLQAPESYDRLQSASGGAYTLIARTIFEKGGIVAGHIWDEQFGVKGFITGDEKDIEILRGTKYLQSDVEGLYLAVRKYLNENKLVLFSGTPCQNAAMRSFLKRDYDNLIMTDFVCMGIDSPLAFKKYIYSLENQYQSKVIYFKAKSKEVGWRYLTNKAVFENGKSYFGINGRDANLNATFLNVLVRPSCYDCKYKGFPRVSDMTIGDYWRKKYDYDPLDDNSGTSYIMLHNDKAISFFDVVKKKCYYRDIDFTKIIEGNRYATSSLPKPLFSRTEFYERLHKEDYSQLVGEYINLKQNPGSIIRKTKQVVKSLLYISHYCHHSPRSFIRTLYFNLFSSKVKSNMTNGDIVVLSNTKLYLYKGSTLRVKGVCVIGEKNITTSIRLGLYSSLSLDNSIINEGSSIIVEDKALVNIGYRTILDRFVLLHAQSGINIGDFSKFEDHVIIDDTNQGVLYFNERNIEDRRINIGTHVLLNRGCSVKAGSTLNDETIVQEYSVVNGSFNPRVVLSGIPATIIAKNIFWKHNFDLIWNYRN